LLKFNVSYVTRTCLVSETVLVSSAPIWHSETFLVFFF
jgi:hypothetical protein